MEIDDAEDLKEMMEMMSMMKMWKQMESGWKKEKEVDNDDDDDDHKQGQWWEMENNADYKAYQKWCEEKKTKEAEFAKQQELIDMYNKQEEARKAAKAKAMAEMEAKAKHESMMMQWHEWQQKLSQQEEYDGMMSKIEEMKHKYTYAITCEVLKMCKCSNWLDDITKYFDHDGFTPSGGDLEIDDMDSIDTNNELEVARYLLDKPAEVQVKAFFGGLSETLCKGAEEWIMKVYEWDKQYQYMDRLM